MSKRIAVVLTAMAFFIAIHSADAQVERVEKGNLVIEGVPEIPQQIVDRMQQYQNTRSASLQDWLPGGDGILISTRFAETNQLHLVKTPGGARQQITFFDEPVGGATVNPDARKPGFIYSKDIGGSENYQLYHFNLTTGTHTLLTDGKSRNGSAAWSNTGDRFAFTSTKRNGSDYDIYIADVAHPEKAQMVLERAGFWGISDWSPDDSQILLINYVSINESYIHTLDLASQKPSQINPSKDKIGYGNSDFSKDGKGIYFTSDENSEFKQLKYYDFASKKITALAGETPWDVDGFELSDDGKYLAYVVNEGGVAKLHVMDLSLKARVALPEVPVGLVYGLEFSQDGKRLAMVLNTAQTPGDVYVLDIGNGSLARWTYSEVGGLQTENFVTPELIHYETYDQVNGQPRQIPAFLYKPKNLSGQPLPVIISIHGGPEGQYQPYFSWTVQYLVNEMGIAVLAPNVRGSSGYGKTYLQLDNGFNREESVQDIGKLLDWIAKQPALDATRVAVMGGSYGGYMVLSSMSHYNDRLRCGIDIVGISNFVTFLENTSAYRRDLRRAEYGDERDPKMREFLQKVSPTNIAHKITKPMLIAQGLNDPRVPASESEQMVEVIRKNGGSVWYILAKDEGHGFSKKSNSDYYYNAVAQFLQTFLLSDETSMN